MTSSLLDVRCISKVYRSGTTSLTVLREVSFVLGAGTTCALVGPSGSGKTTLLSVCAGLDRPTAGTVRLDGVALNDLDEEALAALRSTAVGFIFQTFQLISTLTALENVMVPLELRGDRRAKPHAVDLLHRVGLGDRRHHYPVQLSGGEQQRVALARAFIGQPRILFADEPTGNLDAETSEVVIDLLFNLNREVGTTLLLVTHNLELAQRTQRIIRLKGGAIVEDRVQDALHPIRFMSTDNLTKNHAHAAPSWSWFILMAWRDSRGSRHRLLLATFAITIGIAALVAVGSFRANVEEAVNQQAKSLLGADIAISNQQPFSPAVESIITAIGGEQARELSCASMIMFPKNGGTRLAQVRAVAGNFPFYGILETVPPEARQTFRSGFHALVDDNLLLQFAAQVGDPIKIGEATFQIVGRLKKIPGEAVAAALIGPRIYIPMDTLEATDLLQKGSRATYKAYLRLPSGTDPDQRLAPLQEQLNTLRVDSETFTKRAARVGKVMTNLARFLSLVGFVALLLGGIGVASAMQVHGQTKATTVALLHCLGATPQQTLAVYFLQTLGLGLGGGIIGVMLGLTVHAVLPSLLRDFLPVQIALSVSWWAVLHGLLAGAILTPLFALGPLLTIRRVSPLRALRVAYEQDAQGITRDPLQLLVLALIVFYTAGFAIMQTARWTHALTFCAALITAFAFLIAVGKSLMTLARASFPESWSYPWRQGLANLFRPHNQTLILILTLGAGTFLLLTLLLVQQSLLQQVTRINETNQPNLVLFDIQSDQREVVTTLIRASQLPVLQDIPLVTMRLAGVNGKSIAELRNDLDKSVPDWALQWEYRSTYRPHLIDSETVVAGTWFTTAEISSPRIPISLEEEIARTLKVTLGDELVFDVQGVPLTTLVQSLRKVDWNRMQPNFFVVFPVGVLETAPQTYVLLTKTLTNEQSATLQRAVVQEFPNVSAIDLTVILHTLDAILSRVTFALRFMALLSLAAGGVVLIGAVYTTYAQRLRETVLLRTLGASRGQLRRILLTEYLFLGSFAAGAGVLLAVIASWALARFLFEVMFVPSLAVLVLTPLMMIGLTMLIGVIGNREVITHPPLEVLRGEG